MAIGVGAFFGSIYAPEKRHYQSVGSNSGQAYPADGPRNGLADVGGIDRLTESIIAKPQPRNTDEREQRDLAAQESMAVFAYWMFWGILLQTLLAGGALIALVKDLRQNRKSAEAQLRAYLVVDPGGINEFESGFARVPLNVTNVGQTPAFNLTIFSNFGLSRHPLSETTESMAIPLIGGASDGSIGPSRNQWVFAKLRREFVKEHLMAINSRDMAIIHMGYVTYDDIFGKTRTTSFAYYHWGEELSDNNAKTCRFGNSAT